MLYSLIDLHERSLFCKFASATILAEIIADGSDAGYEHIAEKNPIKSPCLLLGLGNIKTYWDKYDKYT